MTRNVQPRYDETRIWSPQEEETMGFRFVGGPYDGMELDHTLVNRYATLAPVNGDLDTRLFVLMPSREDWDRIIRGEEVRPETLYPYERVFGPEGAWFRASPPGALDRARSESRLKLHSRARTALAALSEEDRRQVIEAVDALQQQPPDRWSKEKVIRISEDEPVYLLRVSPELRAFIRIAEGHQIELFDIVREEALRLFLERTLPAGASR
jgi:hypothetical protein